MVPRISTRGDYALQAMTPHTFIPAMEAVCRCKLPRVRHHFKWKRRWMGVKGSRRNGWSDPKCPSALRLRMIREDTGASSVDATCAWMAADEGVGSTPVRVHCLRCCGLLDDWYVEGVLSLFFV
ncbi:uncharacterized protein TNCV_5112101 [Trichonephila clavipes]|uniref:Uncharacterized protein n=1 Tax=Trichonephila clavipes TaxID=2585209 RepID=A0A8X6WEY8_TRICX|nr:uncharacterized protein TNCV_5112101 [Trichonephila clavipes]